MKKTFTTVARLIGVLSISSCSSIHYETASYVKELDYHEGYKILQLTDIHWSLSSNIDIESAFLSKVISEASPDLIICTGDSFMDASASTVDTLYNFMDSKNIPWTVTFGNHDTQGLYSPSYVATRMLSTRNGVFTYLSDDDIYGDSNYILNLVKQGEVKWQLYCLDSNSYINNGITDYNYDYIHQDQISWYENAITDTNKGSSQIVPSLAFFHIPLPEFGEAWASLPVSDQIGLYNGSTGVKTQVIKEGKQAATYIFGEMNEESCPSKVNNGFFDSAKKMKSTKGIFVGHDHINAFAVEYDGITLSYGLKSGDGCYYQDFSVDGVTPFTGGQLITLKDDGTFDLSHVSVAYKEIM